jgi:hypothetical protein
MSVATRKLHVGTIHFHRGRRTANARRGHFRSKPDMQAPQEVQLVCLPNDTRERNQSYPMNRSISRTLNFLGSSGLPTVFTRATTFANSFDDLRVIVLSMTGTNEPGEGKGFRAWSTYVPFRELNGDTWKSFIQMSVNLFFDTSSAGDSEPGVLPELGGVEPSSKYMRLSPNVLLTSRIIFLRS